MSISFWVSEAPETFDYFTCMCVRDMSETPRSDCPDCHGSGVYVSRLRSAEFNFSNSNGLYLLDYLQELSAGEVVSDHCGEIPVEKLRGLHALIERQFPISDLRMLDFDQRLRRFQTLLLAGIHHNGPVRWG